MQLFVQGQAIHTVDVSEETTVDDLKEALASLEGIPAGEQVVSYGGVPLEGGHLVCDAVPELGTVSLTARVVGGE